MNNDPRRPVGSGAGSGAGESQSITLWLACVTAVIAALTGGIASFWFSALVATLIGLIPIVAFGAWRLILFLQEENEAGLNTFDRISIAMGGLSQRSEEIDARPFIRLGLATVVALVVIAGIVVVMKSGGKSGGGATAVDTGAPAQNGAAPGSAPAASPEARHGDGPYDVQIIRLATLAWPANGVLSGYFEQDDPQGITIDLPRSADTPIVASARGVAESAGGEASSGYGYNIVLQHEDDWSTLYANLGEILVTPGQHVEKGDVIAYGGSTGGAARKQLHYELRHAGHSVDPLLYLPSTQSGVKTKPAEQISCPATGIIVDPNSTVNLVFVGQSLDHYRIETVGDVTYTDPAAPEIVVRQVGPLSLTLAVPAAAAPATGGIDYVMNLVLAKDEDHLAIECHLRLKTASSVPFEPSAAQVQSQSSPTPAAQDSSGQAAVNETPAPDQSPTATPAPTSTPIPSLIRILPTATPVATTTDSTTTPGKPSPTPRPGVKQQQAGKPTPTHFPKLP